MENLILIILGIILFSFQTYPFKKAKRILTIKEISIFVFFLYLLIFIKYYLLKDGAFTLNLESTMNQANLIPLRRVDNGLSEFLKMLVITMPFGFFIFYFSPDTRTYSKLLGYGLCISLITETLQLFKIHECWDINDILINIIGFLLGGIYFQSFSFISRIPIKEVPKLQRKIAIQLTCIVIITYMIGIGITLYSQTDSLSILDNKEVIHLDEFKITADEKLSNVDINAYYQTKFNRLKHFFSTKLILTQEPMYRIYKLREPYKSLSNSLYGILVIGWNTDAKTVKLTYENQTYEQKIEPGLFTAVYPTLVDNQPILDIYSLTDSNLNIQFYDESNNVVDIPFNHLLD